MSITIYPSDDIYKKIYSEAYFANRSISKQVEYILEKYYEIKAQEKKSTNTPIQQNYKPNTL